MKQYLCIFFLFPSLLFAQQNIPLNREWGLLYDKMAEKTDSTITGHYNSFESCFKPYIAPVVVLQKDKSKSLIYRKLKKESLFIVRDTTDKFYLTIDPLFNLERGLDLNDSLNEQLKKNTRGVLVRGNIGNTFSFESSFYENQANYAQYIDDYIKSTNDLFPQTANYTYDVIPGQGRSKKFKTNGYDYAMASGYLSYSPNTHFNFQVGHGKHFIGDGYRSLLLSDNAFNYPYARITSSFGKVQYTNLYTVFMNLSDGGVTTPPSTERLFQKKAGSFQFLNWNIHKRITLGLFQGMIWEASDTKNQQHLNFNYYNPIIYSNALVYSFNSTNNVLLGGTLKIKLSNSVSIYSQYVMDDIASRYSLDNKNGYQIGTRIFDLFGINNLHLQGEYNQIRPYTYSHRKAAQNYSHFNQALAHPLGSNFKELVGFLNYRISDFFMEFKYSYAVMGKDSVGRNYGNNLFLSNNDAYYGVNSTINQQNQGLKTTLSYLDFKLGYLLNPSTNLNVIMGVSMRKLLSDNSSSETDFIYVGIRTSLTNYYYDF